jgi:hypothetical protein
MKHYAKKLGSEVNELEILITNRHIKPWND